MPIARIAVLLLLASAFVQARADLPGSPACVSVLQRLTAAEDTAAASKAGAPGGRPLPAHEEALRAARRQAALVCLGTAEPSPPATRARQPESAPGIALFPLPPRPRLEDAAAARPAVPARPSAPLTVTSCDAGGCWTSEGTRLPRQGALLLGPRGHCSQVGALLNCP